MMRSAQRYRELVADFATQGAGLSELQVMRISGCLLTNETTLAADEGEVVFAPSPGRLLWKGEAGLLSGRGAGSCENVAGCLRWEILGERPSDRWHGRLLCNRYELPRLR
ncbi:hypothetical protein ABIA06_002552 [Bradyrhizobium yuanmingense]